MFAVAVENSFDFRSEAYAALFRTSDATAFQHPLWLEQLYARLVPDRSARPLIIVVRRAADGGLAMVLPLVRRRYGVVRLIEFADLKVSDYAAAVCEAATFDQILGDPAALQQIGRALRPFDLLRVPKLRDGSPRLEQLLGAEPRRGMAMNAYAVELTDDYEAWRTQHLNASHRKELDKKLRQLHRKGSVSFACSTDAVAIRATFEAIRGYRRTRFRGREGEDLLQLAPYFDFYVGIALSGLGGLARTYTITVDGQPIAGALGLSHEGRFLVIVAGFDQDRYKNQSIGSLMFEQIARDCIERGDTLLDFTIGDEPYKLAFGATPLAMWKISRPGSPIGYVAEMIIDRVPGAKTLVKRLLPRRTGQVSAHAEVRPEAT